jgi:hypothetical protein
VGDELDHGLHALGARVVSALEQVVDPAYHHAPKVATPQPSIMLGDAILKWYDIAPPETPVPIAIRALARRCLRDGIKTGALGVKDGLGFVILHRCGESFYFLLVSTWRNENELWETVWAKRDESDVFFKPWPMDGTHRPTFCVWELGAVAHERIAWSGYLRSERDEISRRAYLQACYAGEV